MKKQALIITLLAAAWGCASQNEPTAQYIPSNHPEYDAAKIVNKASDQMDNTTLLLNLDSDSVLSEPLQDAGVISLEKLFFPTKGKEDLMKRLGMDRWFIATLKEGIPAEDAAMQLSACDEVRFIEYNNKVEKASDCVVYPYDESTVMSTKASGLFNDPSLPDQWNLINNGDGSISSKAKIGGDINVKDVWANLTTGDPSIIVAVIDEGVKYDHPDLAANMWTSDSGYHGYNAVKNSYEISWGQEGDTGHGTHCAGIIAAVNNNGVGISSVAGGSGNGDGVRIMSCQLFDGNSAGNGSVGVAARAIQYAADNGASIISCSFGYQRDVFASDKEYTDYAKAEVAALQYFEAPENANNPVLNGNIAIFSAGNNGDQHSYYPGALSYIISVSALAPDMLPAYYTNYGPGCNIAAPGGEYNHKTNAGDYTTKSAVLSTLVRETSGSDYGYMQGSSMACPHVSGIAALALSYAKKLGKKFTVQEFKNMIITSANDIDTDILAVGSKSSYVRGGSSLNKYYHNMGTGAIDTWVLMTKIEGIPSVQISVGADDWVDLSRYFSTAYSQLTYLGVEVLGNGKEALGLAKDPYIQYNRLFVHPTKVGACKLRVRAIGGGDELGGDNAIGGMEVSQDISIIARPGVASNGAWL